MMGDRLGKAPVFYALAQIKFNRIAKIEKYADEVAERLRKNGFPDSREDNQVEVSMRNIQGKPDVSSRNSKRWIINNIETTEGYLLAEDYLVFHTTNYTTSSDFLTKLNAGLALVHEVVDLAYVERMGMRYMDAIIPEANESLEMYLQPSLLGLSSFLEGELQHSYTETLIHVDEGKLVVKNLINDKGLAMPPDLVPMVLEVNERFKASTGRVSILDTDFFIERREPLNLDNIREKLKGGSDILSKAFKTAVTPEALKKWR